MAIAFNAISKSAYSPGTSVTWAHTCTGSNLMLWVYAYCGTNAAASATYNGVSMTAGPFLAMTGGAAGQYIRSWYLINPATGVNNCVITSTSDMYGFGSSYTGVAQSGQPDVSNSNGGNGITSLTTSVTTTTDNDWLVGFAYTGTSETAGANTILRGNTGSVLYIIDSNSAQTPAGSKSMNVTFASTFAGMLVAAIKPVATAPSANPAFLLNFI